MKGSNKDFSRFLQSEYHDDYLEVPNNDQKVKQAANQEYSFPLTNHLLADFMSALSTEAQKCFTHLCEIKSIKTVDLRNFYEDIYSKFYTVPVLFLSVIPNEAVYVWQINRKCPYEEGTDRMVLDSMPTTLIQTKAHPSLLMLAKITSFNGEEILDAQFVGDSKLLVKSKLDSNNREATIRCYDIKVFRKTVRINPYNSQVVANNLHTFKLLLRGYPLEEKEECLEISLFQKIKPKSIFSKVQDDEKDEEEKIIIEDNSNQSSEVETLQQSKVCKGLCYQFKGEVSMFNQIFVGPKNYLVLIDKENSLIITVKDSSLFAINYGSEVGGIEYVFENKGCYYLVNINKHIFEFNPTRGPEELLKDMNISFSPIPAPRSSLKQPQRKCYEITSSNDSIDIFYVADRSLVALPIQTNKNHETLTKVIMPQEIINYDNFSWTFVGSKKDILVTVYYEDIKFYEIKGMEYQLQRTAKVPNKMDWEYKYVWDIIGSGERIFLFKFSNDHQNIQNIIEMKINIIDGRIVPEFCQVSLGFPLELSRSDRSFAQVEGLKNNILFIPGVIKRQYTRKKGLKYYPFYYDKANLVCSNSIFLVNPHNENSKSDSIAEAKHKEERKEENNKTKTPKKIDEVKKDMGHTRIDMQQRLEETKRSLKDLREDIRSKLTLAKKADENDKKKKRSGSLEEPKEASKHLFEVYKEIKSEKRRIVKIMDKEKNKIKQERAFKEANI